MSSPMPTLLHKLTDRPTAVETEAHGAHFELRGKLKPLPVVAGSLDNHAVNQFAFKTFVHNFIFAHTFVEV